MAREMSCFKVLMVRLFVTALLLVMCVLPAAAQKKPRSKPAPKPADNLSKLREQFVAATNDYKSSLAKLQVIYEKNVKQADERLAVSRKLLNEGLISRNQVEENERALATEKDKLAETDRLMAAADTQV